MEERRQLEQQLVLTEEHVAKAAELIARQGKIAEELERGHSYLANSARTLLSQYQELHATLAFERVRLLHELRQEMPDAG